VTAFAFGVGSFCNANRKGVCWAVVDADDDDDADGVWVAVSPILGLDIGEGVGDWKDPWLSVRKEKS
jgi:hypothetical protein